MKDNQNTKDKKHLDQIILYTDGACSGNPGPGGWGVVIIMNYELGIMNGSKVIPPKSNNKPILLSGKAAYTTNNQMELTAVIKGLERVCKQEHISLDEVTEFKEFDFGINQERDLLHGKQLNIVIYLDSQYVRQGIQEWIRTWKHNGWKTSGKKPVANKELRQELDVLVGLFDIQRHWVKGHNGNKYNEIADKLATGINKVD